MLKAALEPLRNYMKELQKERVELRSNKELTPASLDTLALSSSVTELWESLRAAVKQDIYRYTPSEQDMAHYQQAEGGSAEQPLLTSEERATLPPPETMQLEAQARKLVGTTYTANLVQNISANFAAPDFSALPPALPYPNKVLLCKTKHDIEYLSNNLGNFGAVGLSTLQKLHKVEEYMVEGATGNAMRLLKAARAADPHNNVLAHIFSQTEYFHASHGHGNALPDARSEAHKSGALNEAVDGQTLLNYRYDAVSCERACSEKKAIEWIQEFYILDPEQTGGSGGGLAKRNCMHLKSWLLLTTINSQLWGDYVFNSIDGLVDDTVGGAALYLHLLRPKVLQELKMRAVAPAGIEDVEKRLSIAYAAYLELKNASRKWQEGTTSQPWTVRNRFLTDFYNAAPFPSFDEVLMNISLNGRSFEKRAFPTAALIEKGYEKEQYWRLWAVALAPENAQRTCNILPFVETAPEKDFYQACEKALVELEQDEHGLINHDEWDLIEPHMPHLSLEHLLAASTRSDRPRSKFVPTIPPFNTYYREWGMNMTTSPLPSVLIKQNAALGAFASSQEMFAALEGADLMIHDPNYGLENQQKLAQEIAKKKTRRSAFGAMSFGTNKRTPGGNDANVGQLFVYVFVPLLVVSFVVFFLLQVF